MTGFNISYILSFYFLCRKKPCLYKWVDKNGRFVITRPLHPVLWTSRSYMPNCHQNVFLMTCQTTARVGPLGLCWNKWDPLPSPVTGFVVQSWESPLPRCPCVKRACGQASAPRQMQVRWGLRLLGVMRERVPVEGTRERKWTRRSQSLSWPAPGGADLGVEGPELAFPTLIVGTDQGCKLHAARAAYCCFPN